MSKTVYLAGPISGLDYDDANGWRDQVGKSLAEDGISALSPLRSKVYLRELGPIKDSYNNELTGDDVIVNMSTSRGITTRDRFDCMNCDVLLVNLLGTKKVSIGTVMEIAWADANRTPIVLIMEENDNLHDHAMINECVGYRVTTILQAIHVVKSVLGPY